MTQEQTMVPFMHPHQINFIRHQLLQLIGAFYFAGDYRVLAASRENVEDTVLSLFPGATPAQRALLQDAKNVRDRDELKAYMSRLEPYIIPFPEITAAEIRKLFPKVKKLVLPDLENLDRTKLTYLGWRDIATNSLYLVSRNGDKWAGTEFKFVAAQKNRTMICSWCHSVGKGDDVALVTSRVKTKIVDGYKTQGNHLCLDSAACNARITSTTEMEALLASFR
ncbi:fibronectin-binding protein (FBP) [Tumebacillus sp. BK434]|uniref:FusB/FusC family EF-G-binding protein n=1 Tax=Tumebacillus sp. BK434 TaxID=2512169 RepID=UPI0010510692|nr:FusB/FusC family EF-G-binding protein [Tumebacillus sp. BK434]TCP52152.1 fibronectin-binding protein (FBP) [Tumebacillus sp. BK434]